jgi:hypothetical protein
LASFAQIHLRFALN